MLREERWGRTGLLTGVVGRDIAGCRLEPGSKMGGVEQGHEPEPGAAEGHVWRQAAANLLSTYPYDPKDLR